MILKAIRAWLADPVMMRRANGWLTVLWFIAALPICLYLSDSVAFLVFVSVYAVVTGHLSTWQAARVEVRQEVIAAKDVGAEVTDALLRNTTLEGVDE